ncbi:NADH-quinone oxidoreductase subunit C [Thermodesulfovibrionales bacterium]|nr:NADH-quinone oxidoreductase subunit C [Thermodesulfovibrionales bacterium]MCL0061632.1 NADH-quinone oxidoreductase subunit C [Thermodesulfovibrionales bacterium]MCL0066455.1 NADH-quinone oxidoreductase subunit C [Thermodesulfovibrionales bacterium]MCL0096659.1 NADH-quinone oxidoreductase subunit C [Thermodesulfovibrionales bacterium]
MPIDAKDDIKDIAEELGGDLISAEIKGRSGFLLVKSESLIKVVNMLCKKHDARLITITGYDPATSELMVIYHFDIRGAVISVKVSVSKQDPRLPSIVEITASANLYERETYEMIGIIFEGHPNLKKLFLEEGRDKPLRKW